MTKTHLLLLSGTLGNERLWQHQLEHLSNLATISVPDLTQHTTIKLLAQNILHNAPEQFALAGFSMGGIIAQEILKQAPERVSKLALLDTSTGTPDDVKLERFESWQSATESTFNDVLKALSTWLHPDNTQLQGVIQEMAEQLGLEVFKRQAGVLLTQRNDKPSILQNFRRPSVIIHGLQDPVSSIESHEQLAALLPNAKRIALPNCGHYAPLEKPEVVSAIMQYWLQE